VRRVSWRSPASVRRQQDGSSRCRSAPSAPQWPSPASVTAWLPCAGGRARVADAGAGARAAGRACGLPQQGGASRATLSVNALSQRLEWWGPWRVSLRVPKAHEQLLLEDPGRPKQDQGRGGADAARPQPAGAG